MLVVTMNCQIVYKFFEGRKHKVHIRLEVTYFIHIADVAHFSLTKNNPVLPDVIINVSPLFTEIFRVTLRDSNFLLAIKTIDARRFSLWGHL